MQSNLENQNSNLSKQIGKFGKRLRDQRLSDGIRACVELQQGWLLAITHVDHTRQNATGRIGMPGRRVVVSEIETLFVHAGATPIFVWPTTHNTRASEESELERVNKYNIAKWATKQCPTRLITPNNE